MSRIACITGTRKGIGRHLALHLLEKGWIVAGCSRKECDLEHTNYKHYRLDVGEEDEVVNVVRQIKRELGPIYALINNAGTATMNHILLSPKKSYDRIFDTNVLGTYLMLRECGKQMSRSGGGRIVNFTSIARPLGLEGEALYAASKASVESLTQIAAKELANFNITVNAIGPTPIETDLIKNVPPGKIQTLIERQAIPRFGTVEDVANCIDFFLQDASAFITGQTIYLGGVT
ncbi:MAG: SDR family oxidoreductase [Puniceicoccaceae bacterium]|nr:MAG: SDR family oxidoreductase [Puniceicoccaceae bacterium]